MEYGTGHNNEAYTSDTSLNLNDLDIMTVINEVNRTDDACEIETPTPTHQQGINALETTSSIKKKPPLKRQGKTMTTMLFLFAIMNEKRLSDTLHIRYICKWIISVIFGICFLSIPWLIITKFFPPNCDKGLFSKDILGNTFIFAYTHTFLVAGWFGWNICDILKIERSHKPINVKAIFFISILIHTVITGLFVFPFLGTKADLFAPMGALPLLFFLYYYGGWNGVRISSVVIVLLFTTNAVLIAMATLLSRISGGVENGIMAWIYPWYIALVESIALYLLVRVDCFCSKKNAKARTKFDKQFSVSHNDDNWERVDEGAISLIDSQYVYVLCGIINILAESYKLSALISIRENRFSVVFAGVTTVVSEIFTRLNLYYEIMYRVVGKENPPLDRVYSVYLGCKIHTEYIPPFVVLFCNVAQYRMNIDEIDCSYTGVQSNMTVNDIPYWWIIPFYCMVECGSDVSAFYVHKLLKKYNILKKGDQSRRVTYVVLSTGTLLLATATFVYWSTVAFYWDNITREQQSYWD